MTCRFKFQQAPNEELPEQSREDHGIKMMAACQVL